MQTETISSNEMVSYCEFLFMGNAIEQKIPYALAIKKFKAKIETLKNCSDIIRLGSFLGIKTLKGKWIIENIEDYIEE